MSDFNATIFLLTDEDHKNIKFINQTISSLKLALANLPDDLKDHIKYEIEVFNQESNYLTDMLNTIS